MNTSATLQQLRDLRLDGMARSYESVLQLPSHQHPEGHLLVAQLIDAERLNRLQNRTQLLLKQSRLRFAASLEELSFGKERNLSKDQIAQLADCSFISRAENILISGATGAGKSFLACA